MMPHLLLLIASFVLPVFITSAWDIAVITKGEVEFFSNGVSVGVGHGYLKELAVGAYDPIQGYLYISDSNHPNTSIFRVDVQQFKDVDSAGFYFEPIASKQSSVLGIAFDPINSTLFWTTGTGNTILKYKVPPPVLETWTKSRPTTLQHPGTVLHQFDDGSVPRGIAVDSCSQTLYWTNIKPLGATIERSKTDGSQREELMPKHNEHVKIFQPYSIIVDQQTRHLYWCDAIEGSSYQIVRSDLDGNNLAIVISHSGQEPYGLTLAGDTLYWTDSHQGNLFSLAKNSVNATEPTLVKKFGRSQRPDGVVSNALYLNLKTEECPALAPILPQIQQLYESEFHRTSLSPFKGDINCSAEVNPCSNNGRLIQEVCECPVGFSGAHCEHPVCHNYCLNGSCDLDEVGQPTCKCHQGWSGDRCQTDMCINICSNGGQCSIDKSGAPVCQCTFGFSGQRCEFELKFAEKLCKIYCEVEQTFPGSGTIQTAILDFRSVIHNLEQLSLPVCSCPLEVHTSSVTNNHKSLKDNGLDDDHLERPRNNIVIIVILGSVCALLGGLAMLLMVKVLKLRKHPRIRKRIVVNRPSPPNFCNPPAAREQCEITIENCCNMNICETPCFEPEFRSSKPTFNKKKSEDRMNLISDMYSDSNLNLSDENQ